MSWQAIPLHGTLGPHAADWDALNASLLDRHPLLTSLFIEHLLRQFGTGKEVLMVYRTNGQAGAMCLLQACSPVLWSTFQPAQLQIAPVLVPHSGLLRELWRKLPLSVQRIDLLCCDPAFGPLSAEAPAPSHRLGHALTMDITVAGSFADYWKLRPRSLPSSLRRYAKRMAADGIEAEMRVIDAAEAMPAAVARYAELEARGWKGAAGTAVGSSPAQFSFYRDLMTSAAAQSQAMVYELWFGDRLAAARLALRVGPVRVFLKTGYDEQLASYAPGRTLLQSVLETEFAREPGTIEFYTDADPNLLEWATGQRWIQHVSLYRNQVANAVLALLRHVRMRPTADHAGVTCYQTVEDLPESVLNFLDKTAKTNPQAGALWYRNMVANVFSGDTGIRFYVLCRQDEVRAVLPLRMARRRFGAELSGLANYYTSLYQVALANNLKARELLPLLSAVEGDVPGYASLMLTPMDPAAHGYQTVLAALRLKGLFPFEFHAFGNWFQPVRESWQQYFARRHGAVRNTVTRMSKRIQSEGGRVEILRNMSDLPRALKAFADVYQASWKKAEPYPEFVPGLIRAFMDKGQARIGIVWLGEQAIAVQAWLVTQEVATIYKLAYHRDYKQYAPGTVLTARMMQYVWETDGVKEIDFLNGDERFKSDWMDQRRERWGIVAYNLRSLRGALGLLRQVGGQLLRGLNIDWKKKVLRDFHEKAG